MTVRAVHQLILFTAAAMLLGACGADQPSGKEPASASPTAPETATTAEEPTPDIPADELQTRLLAAAWDGDTNRAEELIDAGADVNAKDDTEQSAFLIAASEGHLDLLRLALRSKADLASLDSFQGTALIRAAERGHALEVGELVQAGIDLDHVNNLGYQAIHEAVWLGEDDADYADTVRVLVASGATIDAPSTGKVRMTPLQMARERGYDQLASILTTATEPVAADDATATLQRAAANGDADLAARALRAGAELDAQGPDGRNALLSASIGNHLDVARLLVAMGADPDLADDNQDTAWLVTGVTGSVPMLEALLPAGPDVNSVNRFGGTSAIPASERGHADYVRRVVRTSIDVDHVNDLGWTALLEAIVLGDGGSDHQQIVDILLEAGADPSLADRNGITPLQHAEQRGYREIADSLRAAG